MTNWQMASALSGLLSGFTFFVIYSNPPVQTDALAYPALRDVASITLCVSIALAFQSAMLGLIMMHFLNKVSFNDVQLLEQFILKFNLFLDTPNKLNILTMLSLSLSITSLVACLYPYYVAVTLAVLFGSVAAVSFILDASLRVFVRDKVIPRQVVDFGVQPEQAVSPVEG